MNPRDIFIHALADDILELAANADALDHSDLTGQAMAIAMAAWQRAAAYRGG